MSTISEPYVLRQTPKIMATHRRSHDELIDVLQFDGEYIHCGEPMHAAGSDLHSIYSPVTTEPAAQGVLEVYLSTRVLRCGCGFQMEIPS
ncbi:hypothetical protein [Arthrobacter sp. HMWF013]|uniref:hypothetical protein n=1 Tax=Arthrobacter sp. HMWF013 TaxID=2056849 RepID=UPI000D3CAC00|nr:hypothetical protein [Arthrobacter sp. HMWF013]PTT68507.1 hypothetical protein DBR22_06375 [Arthrobacter sp. HMWF013]